MGIMHRRLRDYLGKEIIVVMTDGRAFKGTLGEFDETAVVLKDVLETSSTDIKWRQPLVPSASHRSERRLDIGSELDIGETERLMTRLKEVVLATSGILRVWLWNPDLQGVGETDRTAVKKG